MVTYLQISRWDFHTAMDLLSHIRPHSTQTTQAPQLTSHSQVVVHVVVRTARAREGGRAAGWGTMAAAVLHSMPLVWLLLQGGREKLYGPTASHATDTNTGREKMVCKAYLRRTQAGPSRRVKEQ